MTRTRDGAALRQWSRPPIVPVGPACRYRVLGLVAAESDGRACDLGPAKQRRVLTRLLVAEGEPVRVDDLTETVWGPAAPAKPRASLQAYVSRLRRVLGGDETIVAVPGGYVLPLDAGELDLHVAERILADQVQGALSPDEVAGACRRGLALWRGTPAADLGDLVLVGPLRSRAFELRRRLVRERAAALLTLGRAADAACELAGPVEEYRYDEDLQRLQLRALVESGRWADALAAYERFRRRLADELGGEPGPHLQRMHEVVLHHGGPMVWRGARSQPHTRQ